MKLIVLLAAAVLQLVAVRGETLLMTYQVKVHTSEVTNAQTADNLSFNIVGADGESGFVYGARTEGESAFQQGDTDVVFINTIGIGRPRVLEVKIDGEDGWNVDEIYLGYCHSNLGFITITDEAVWLDDFVQVEFPIPYDFEIYRVDVITSDIVTANSDAPLQFRIEGKEGSTDYVYVDNYANDMERASHNEFCFAAESVGKPTQLHMRLADSNDGWCIDSMQLSTTYDDLDCSAPSLVVTQRVWLDLPCEEIMYDGVTCTEELSVSVVTEPTRPITFHVTTVTSMTAYADTNDDISIRLTGENGVSSGWILLGRFQKGATDVFRVNVDDYIGEVMDISVKNGGSDGWCAESISIDDVLWVSDAWFDTPCDNDYGELSCYPSSVVFSRLD